MIIGGDKRVRSRMAVTAFSSTKFYTVAGGPAGSALMSFYIVALIRRPWTVYQGLFGRLSGALTTGWGITLTNVNTIIGVAGNSTPASVATPGVTPLVGVPFIFIVRYTAGSIQGWFNGVSTGTTTLGAGFTTNAAGLTIGTVAGNPAPDVRIMAAGFLDNYDIAATAVAVNAQWQEDLQQGRYLTPPRALTANDVYWDATDIVSAGGTCGISWTDRGPNLSVMTRTGAPQGAAVPPRFR